MGSGWLTLWCSLCWGCETRQGVAACPSGKGISLGFSIPCAGAAYPSLPPTSCEFNLAPARPCESVLSLLDGELAPIPIASPCTAGMGSKPGWSRKFGIWHFAAQAGVLSADVTGRQMLLDERCCGTQGHCRAGKSSCGRAPADGKH